MPGGVVCGVADVRRGAVAISASTAAIGQYAPAGLARAAFLRVDGVVLVAVSPEGKVWSKNSSRRGSWRPASRNRDFHHRLGQPDDYRALVDLRVLGVGRPNSRQFHFAQVTGSTPVATSPSFVAAPPSPTS